MEWRIVWCPREHCNRFTMGYFSEAEKAEMLRLHEADCDGVRFEQGVAAYEARARLDGRWERVRRRWGLPAEEDT